jgi:predicted nuclease of predicted toxin-antitoxin system
MKLIVDAQLPYLLTIWLREKGFDVIHTDDFPDKERTPDSEIRIRSIEENRIVITKDSDFRDSYFLQKIPSKLLLISTGNIKNRGLLDLFRKNWLTLYELLLRYDFIEMDNDEIIVHE